MLTQIESRILLCTEPYGIILWYYISSREYLSGSLYLYYVVVQYVPVQSWYLILGTVPVISLYDYYICSSISTTYRNTARNKTQVVRKD